MQQEDFRKDSFLFKKSHMRKKGLFFSFPLEMGLIYVHLITRKGVTPGECTEDNKAKGQRRHASLMIQLIL